MYEFPSQTVCRRALHLLRATCAFTTLYIIHVMFIVIDTECTAVITTFLFLQTLFKFLIITYLIIIINTKYAVTAMATVNCASYYRLVIYDYIIWNNTSRRAVQSKIRPQAPLLRASTSAPLLISLPP